mgnify:CR=1 FL=1
MVSDQLDIIRLIRQLGSVRKNMIANLRVLRLKKRKEGNLQNLMLLTTRSMDQHPEGGWMLHIPNQELDINHHR